MRVSVQNFEQICFWVNTGSPFLLAEATRSLFCLSFNCQGQISITWVWAGGWRLAQTVVFLFRFSLLHFKSTWSELPRETWKFYRFTFRISGYEDNFPILFTKGKTDVTNWCYVHFFLSPPQKLKHILLCSLDLRRILQTWQMSGMDWTCESEESEQKQIRWD